MLRFLPAALLLAFPVAAQADAPAITIQSIRYGGAGCPANSAATNISPDGHAFTLTFSDYQASDALRDCEITLQLHIPAGVSFALTRLHSRGFVELPQGSAAELSGAYTFQGFNAGAHQRQFVGPVSQDYVQCSEAVLLPSTPLVERVLPFTLKTGINVSGAGARLGTVDSIDGEIYSWSGSGQMPGACTSL
jgi:hypothetical protein